MYQLPRFQPDAWLSLATSAACMVVLSFVACQTAAHVTTQTTPASTVARNASAAIFSYETRTTANYVAHLHRPSAASFPANAPAVLLIGGSGGGIGWQDYMAERLAAQGIVALAVAYFAFDSLPKELERIPLDGFDNALSWLRSQPGVDAKRLALGGVSKGAEAVLLLATVHPELKAVGVFTPTAYVFQSVTRDFRNTPSWTRNGVDVPYVAYGTAPQGSALVEFYKNGVRDASAVSLAAARIPVERIKAPLLLLSGRNDLLWGSGAFADEIENTLKANRITHFENIVYENAGHLISSIRPDDVTSRGGTKAGNDFAQADGQMRFLNFFHRELSKR